MGNRFEFTVIAADEKAGQHAIDTAVEEVQRIEALLSTFKESSQTNLINQNAGQKPVKVDEEVILLIQRALKISSLTQGAFDLTYGSLAAGLWNFDVNMTSLPDAATALESVHLIDYRNVAIDTLNATVLLKK